MNKQKEYPNLLRIEQKPEVSHIKRMQGVYRIVFTDGSRYVGSSTNLNSRASNYMCRRDIKHTSGSLKRFLSIKGVFGVIEYAPYLSKLDLVLLERDEIIKDGNKSTNIKCPACLSTLKLCSCKNKEFI